MPELTNIQNIYFIGIGGIGMSALARYFVSQGKKVSGYDKTETSLTRSLVKEDISITYADDVSAIPENVQLVIITPAIPKDNKILNYFASNGYEIMKRSEVLGLITRDSINVCVAGTHGKTTISTMIAHIFRDSGLGSNAFLGGISTNYNTNFWSSQNNVCVVEADEYDRSFLKLHPFIGIISAMDADHLDIYGTSQAVNEAFVEFSKKVRTGGTLIQKHGLPIPKPAEGIQNLSYHLTDDNADVYSQNLRILGGAYIFDVVGKEASLKEVRLNMGGRHNVENALAAITACRQLGMSGDKIIPALQSFRGVRRRFEYHLHNENITYIDDYAHHPRELEVLIEGARELFPDSEIIVVFQPHLFSRTRDFSNEFAEVLDKSDQTIVLPVYPARELPIQGIDSFTITDKMTNRRKSVLSKNETLQFLEGLKMDKKTVLITAGAGDIEDLISPITELLKIK
jgi:UDP-N-acetylmuramate--alanine ligase